MASPPPAAQTVDVTADNAAVQTVNAMPELAMPLPGGRAMVSEAAQGKRTVAADAGGTLFRSEDAGGHWKAVKPKWSGRVVRVETTANGFALTTDSAQRWTSRDGRKWSQQK